MKNYYTFLVSILILLVFLTSCSVSNEEVVVETNPDVNLQKITTYDYNPLELETMKLINDYRESMGLKNLEIINHISVKAEEHNFFMIKTNVVSHEGFNERSANIIKVLGANTVSENIAYNFNSSEAVLAAWLKSSTHKDNIVGDYTHFGLAIKTDSKSGKKYFTNIFANIAKPK